MKTQKAIIAKVSLKFYLANFSLGIKLQQRNFSILHTPQDLKHVELCLNITQNAKYEFSRLK